MNVFESHGETKIFGKILLAYGWKFFFAGNNLDTPIPSFVETSAQIASLKCTHNEKGEPLLKFPITIEGYESEIVARAKVLEAGKPGKPCLILIAGFGVNPEKLQWFLPKNEEIDSYRQVGIELFAQKVDALKIAYKVEHLQAAFAMAARLVQESISQAHTEGRKAWVFGSSFGAKTISWNLNTVAEDIDPSLLAEGYVALQGGNFMSTFTGKHYAAKMKRPGVLFHPAFECKAPTFPVQKELPPLIAQRVLAIVNPDDEVAKGQMVTWKGVPQMIISGSHRLAPLKNLFKIRGALERFVLK
jgi:hypothetical protein